MKTDLPISKLPKWAQDHIADLQRERDVAVRELRKWSDNQTESPVSIHEFVCTGETQGPSSFMRYVQTRRIEIDWKGVHLDIALSEDGRMHDDCIRLQWTANAGGTTGHVAMIPTSFQSVSLLSKGNMR